MRQEFDLRDFDEDRIQHSLGWDHDKVELLRIQREHWLRWLDREHHYAFNQLKELKKCCEEDRLVFYLYYLKFYKEAGLLSKQEFRRMMKRLRQAVEDLTVLRNSVIGLAARDVTERNIAGPWDQLREDLDDLLKHVSSFEDLVGRRGNALFDDARAAIVRHVQERMGNPHHESVSALIRAALELEEEEDEDYSPDAHKVWVNRHGRLFRQETWHEQEWEEVRKLTNQRKPASPEG